MAFIFDPGTMANDMTYYWRIDEVSADITKSKGILIEQGFCGNVEIEVKSQRFSEITGIF